MAAQTMRFRLLAGRHSAKVEKKDADGKVVKDEAGNPVKELVRYDQGAVIETDKDLAAIFGDKKFERLPDGGRGPRPTAPIAAAPAAPNPPLPPPLKPLPNLETMSEADLRRLADEEEIDVKSAKTKADLIKAVRASRG